MGLLDVLNGLQNGPRGQREPSTTTSRGMSNMTMAFIALLGYKALKSFTGTQPMARSVWPLVPILWRRPRRIGRQWGRFGWGRSAACGAAAAHTGGDKPCCRRLPLKAPPTRFGFPGVPN
jgi:hypothetical protein